MHGVKPAKLLIGKFNVRVGDAGPAPAAHEIREVIGKGIVDRSVGRKLGPLGKRHRPRPGELRAVGHSAGRQKLAFFILRPAPDQVRNPSLIRGQAIGGVGALAHEGRGVEMTGARILDHAAVVGAGGQHGLCESRDLVGGQDRCPIRRFVDPDIPAVNESVLVGVVDRRRAGDNAVIVVRIALCDLKSRPSTARASVEIGISGRLTVEGGDDRLHGDSSLAVRPVEEVHERRRIATAQAPSAIERRKWLLSVAPT